MAYGVTQQMIDAYGEVIFKLSLNKLTRRGDPVRELDFEKIEEQREGTGLTDEEIAEKVGLLPEQVGVVRVFVERKYHRIDLHRRLFHLGGGKRWKAEEYQHPAERLKIREEGMMLRKALNFHPERAAHYLEKGYWSNETMIQWLNKHASTHPNDEALITSDKVITWAELKVSVDRLTNGLLALGLMKGDVVAVQLPNIPEFLISYIAISAFGGVMQTLHMPYGEADIKFLLGHSKARAVICLPAFREFSIAEFMVSLKNDDPGPKHIVVLGSKAPKGAIAFDSLMIEGIPVVGNPPVGSDPFLLLYTSGTTSNPKGVPLTYQNMLGHARLCAPEFGMTKKDRVLSAAPLSHLYGLYSFHCSLFAGSAAVLLPAFSPEDMERLVQNSEATALFLGPAHAAAFRKTGLIANHDFSSVKYSVFSGAHCPPETLSWWREQTGSGICQLWGMTELASGSFSRPGDDDVALNSAGPVSPGNEIRIISIENGETRDTGNEGELQIRGSSVFAGYLDNPDANSSAFDNDGWFRTGDLAVIDANGNLTITGRIKDIINRGGVKYNPIEIEDIIVTHPKVELTAIIPMPDPVLGEKACCFVQLVGEENFSLGELTTYLETKMISKNKWPERLEIIDDMPLTPTRKVMKGRLSNLLRGGMV